MSLPSSTRESAFDRFLQEMPPDYAELAVQFKAFTRSRKIKTAGQLLQAVLCYSGLDQALRETAGSLTLQEERISDTAVHKRLKAALPWVKVLLQRLMGAGAAALTEGHLRFIVIDGSTVQGPGADQTWYRLHLAVDLVKLHLVHAKVTDKYEGEHLGHYPLREGDVVVVDRGYNQAIDLITQAEQGVGMVVRYNAQGMNLYDDRGSKIDLYEALRTREQDSLSRTVQVRAQGQYIEGHVHACRLPPVQAEKARRQARERARKKGRCPSQRTLLLAQWVLVFTTLPPTLLPSTTLAALYRVRWQVEWVIKRYKSLLDFDRLRAGEGGALAQVYLHGKLLYAWVLERWARNLCGEDWNRLDQPRRATPWRTWKLLCRDLNQIISAVDQWDWARWPACLEVMQERPRRRQLQTLPERVNRLISYCRVNGISNIDPGYA